MECTFENPSTVSLPTLTYAPLQTRIGEPEREKEKCTMVLHLSSSNHRRFLSLCLSFSWTCSRSTTNRRRLVICFHTFAAFASLRLFLHLRARALLFSFSDSFTFSPSTVAREHRQTGRILRPAETGTYFSPGHRPAITDNEG